MSLKEKIIISLAEKYDCTPGQVALNWHLSRGHVVIPKTSSRFKENFEVSHFELSRNDLELVESLNKN